MWYLWRQRTDPTFSSMSQPMGPWTWLSGKTSTSSTVMPPSPCTGVLGGGRAWWHSSHWQSPGPSSTWQARGLHCPCSCTSTQRPSAGPPSSTFWVGNHAPFGLFLPFLPFPYFWEPGSSFSWPSGIQVSPQTGRGLSLLINSVENCGQCGLGISQLPGSSRPIAGSKNRATFGKQGAK